ncbi:MAG: cation:proton antiporter [Anaerolineae bacterium]|nr:cation:proton antiporter [Anaerolineae bacterium]MCZ7553551.1 cation:proton antiporter [Anaerolineales bacterium]
MHELPLLINMTLALVFAFIGGVIARRLGLPTIVGYLLTGIAIGPFTPGFVGDVETVLQLAELGVIFLMFGVGLHFSLNDLWRVRDISLPGALLQTALATLAGFGLSQLWGWSVSAGIVLGISISVASTVVLLRGLMDHSLLNTPHGQAAVGWLVAEDILSVLFLVLMPALVATSGGALLQQMGVTLLKAAAFVVIMFFVGVRLLPWVLDHVAHTRSRELFILAILAITLGVALGSSELFGVSLALGAFIAGAIVSQSHLSHQVGADVFTIREAFSVLFFVSVGMLVNPIFLWQNLGKVLALTLLVVVGKLLIVILLGTFFPHPAKTFLVIAVGLSQIGEFSFILGQGGLGLKLLETDQYSLILAAALISISLNPMMYRLLPWLERTLRRAPHLWKRLESHRAIPQVDEGALQGHAIVIGYGRIGKLLADTLHSLGAPLLVIESDAERIDLLNNKQILTLYGDAGNSEVITHAHLQKASALVTTVPDETSAYLIVTAARDLNPDLPIIARAATEEGVRLLAARGANHVVQPELEGGLEMVRHTLLQLDYPLREVHEYVEAIRHSRYEKTETTVEEYQTLHDLVRVSKGIEVVWIALDETSALAGQTLAEANLRFRSGASVIAVVRGRQLIANPKSHLAFEAGDRVGLIGEEEQIEAARRLICS